MKFQTVSAISFVAAVAGQYDTTIPSPVCAKFKAITMAGVGEFVDTDGSGVSPQTTGDMSISFNLSGVAATGSYPNQSYFSQISLDMNAVCVVKTDQPFFPADAPVCFYEAEMRFSRNYVSFPDDVVVEKVPIDKVVDVEKLLSSEPGAGRRTQFVRGSEGGVVAEPRSAPDNRQLQKNVFQEEREELVEVEAVEVTDKVFNLDPDLMKRICPQRFCLIPLNYLFKRKGGFTAHGTGSQDIKITGGTAGLFGAFGQMITPDSGINILAIAANGDITYEFDVALELCYYRRESGFW